MKYQRVVESIRHLNWPELTAIDLQSLMILSWHAAMEFGESLRVALELGPENKGLRELAAGELNTSNLQFDDYTGPGDHADFLWHFIRKSRIKQPIMHHTGHEYGMLVSQLAPEVRAMSVVSREAELPSIFEQILKAPDWNAPGLDAYRYYLEQHIALDSDDGGHADLMAHLPVDDSVLEFYRLRLDMYRCLAALFH